MPNTRKSRKISKLSREKSRTEAIQLIHQLVDLKTKYDRQIAVNEHSKDLFARLEALRITTFSPQTVAQTSEVALAVVRQAPPTARAAPETQPVYEQIYQRDSERRESSQKDSIYKLSENTKSIYQKIQDVKE